MTKLDDSAHSEAALSQSALQTFSDYSQTFEGMVATGQAKVIAPFFFLPSILIAPSQEPLLMTAEHEVIRIFEQLIHQLKGAGFDHSKLTKVSAKELSSMEVMISGTATRYQDQAETQILEEFGFTYTLRQSSMNWKIILGIIHGMKTAITFD